MLCTSLTVINKKEVIKRKWVFSVPMCLRDPWCSEWGCCESDPDKEDFKEPPKKKAKGKGGKKETGSKQFVSLTSSVEMEKICKGFVPKNTEKATKWVVRVFE